MTLRRILELALGGVLGMLSGCKEGNVHPAGVSSDPTPPPREPGSDRQAFGERREERERMVASQVAGRGIRDERVLAAMRRVPRHSFVDAAVAGDAYTDRPLPIGYGQTISQPFVVGFMSEALALTGGERVLEVGTGSGYQAAILGELAREVWTIELLEPLGACARETLAGLGYANVHVTIGDGYRGWPEHAPFDAIIVTAAPDHVPRPLLDQLAPGGRLILPVGGEEQELVLFRRTEDGFEQERLLSVRFVPLVGPSVSPR